MGTISPPPTATISIAPTAPSSGGACFIFQCGCPDSFKESWCHPSHHQIMSDFCRESQSNCETCIGSWCPFDGPGGSLTTTSTTTSTTSTTTTSTTTTLPPTTSTSTTTVPSTSTTTT